uniref:Cytokine receptor-like factor 3 n=1 Tax=Petromyzon marinus TaxID=7757 RepID=A0AAJ7TXP5_PETMA|nr:cytokine receptor-like factor 3 [Petromyzon marinus]XP_032826078.1 cytokine receptor-like factor 3 [Petromyzon marinus]
MTSTGGVVGANHLPSTPERGGGGGGGGDGGARCDDGGGGGGGGDGADEVRESVTEALNYRSELLQRLQQLHLASQQVTVSGERTLAALESHFAGIEEAVAAAVTARREALCGAVRGMVSDASLPLRECTQLIRQRVDAVEELLAEGEAALASSGPEQESLLASFTRRSLQVQLGSLPEVPALSEVACVRASLDGSLGPRLSSVIAAHGRVAPRAPVQLEEMNARPAAVRVRWCKVDEEFPVQEYLLEYCRGRTENVAQMTRVYCGPDTEFTVAHLEPHADFTFRVGAREAGPEGPIAWSVPVTTSTPLPAHEWRPDHAGFALSAQRDVATRGSGPGITALYSSRPSLALGHSVSFRVERVGPLGWDDTIGLCVEPRADAKSLRWNGALCIASNGAVFVNGKEMTNQLPSLAVGMTVTFGTEGPEPGSPVVPPGPLGLPATLRGAPHRLRVSVACAEREVVSEWLLEQAWEVLYFGCSFTHPGWSVLVF